MKKRLISIIISILVLIYLNACSDVGASSTFSIHFIDVGQGDAALVECDEHYMLIDGGDVAAGDKVYSVLEEKGIQHLDILVMSHLHADHIGGLTKALTYASKIDLTLANATEGDKETFRKVENELSTNGAKIKVPTEGETFELGSAKIEVVDVASETENDSLVLMITYGDTKFLFTGDIEDEAQTRISDKYANEKDEEYKINLIKMPHHGSASPKSVNGTGSLYRFIRTFMPDYAVISVGDGNSYGHPHKETLSLLEDADVKVYRTDDNGDIIVRSDGKSLSFETSK